MKMDGLYEEMKLALDYFGIHFRDMSKVRVTPEEGHFIFTYGDKSLRVKDR